MKRSLAVLAVAGLVATGMHAHATSIAQHYLSVDGLAGRVLDKGVQLTWTPVRGTSVVVIRDERTVAALRPGATGWLDATPLPGTHRYEVVRHDGTGPAKPLIVRAPSYLVGAANRDITPVGVVNQGGYGLGDGSLIPEAVVGRGGRDSAKGEHIRTRAFVVDDGKNAVAIADIEVQGWFAKYQFGADGLQDMALAVSKKITRLPVSHIVIASDHSHAAPDTLGVWGGPSAGYMDFVKAQVAAAITEAYQNRVYADLKAGHSDASDLVYNQSC